MKLGNGDSASWDKNVNGENKKRVDVKASDLMAQGESKAREDKMDLTSGGKLIKPSNRDTYQ